jgi:O-antigen/teichoic acid export membrane protein
VTPITRRALEGIVWAATSSWVRIAISLGSFGVVAHRLTPAELGSFGAVSLLVSLAEATTCAPLGDGLQQQRLLDTRQMHATFWTCLLFAGAAAMLLTACAAPISRAFTAPAAETLLPWAMLGLLLAPAITVSNAIMARSLRFAEISRIGLMSSLLSSGLVLSLILSGAGVWSLLVANLAGRLMQAGALLRASGYRPGPLRHIGAIGPLLRFSFNSVATYWIGYADRSAPRLLTGLLLGAAPLGYLMVAYRVLDLIGTLVLGPLNSVTMSSVARLQDNWAELQTLILSLYRIAAVFGYPAFVGAIIVVPDLARLVGPEWLPAVLATQILLLVGLRTATGMFNIPILRGIGRSGWPLLLLGSGLGLNLLLVPLGAQFGAAGVAGAVLLRTLATWPLGCWMVARATGVSIRAQAMTGLPSLAASLLMAALTCGLLSLLPTMAPLPRLVCAASFGIIVYAGLLAAAVRSARAAVASAVGSLLRGDRVGAAGQLRAALRP